MRRAARRLLGVIPTLLLTWTLVFAALQAMPGDPVALMLGGTPTSDEVIAAERARLGLDRPIAVQYLRFLDGALVGDFGESFRSRQPVMGLIAEQLPYTLSLALGGLVFGAGLGILLGVLAGLFPYGWIDAAIMTLALAGVSLPGFWVAMLLIQLFATTLGWLPVLGTGFWALVMPSISVGLFLAGGLSRLVRAAIIEVMGLDYIRTARAKGLAEWRVVCKHALRNAAIPPLSLLGVQFALLIGGAVVTETVFARPGIGAMLVRAVLEKDYPVVEGITVLSTAAYVVVNGVIDILYGALDPRTGRT
jgi:ABC-type dipeptide/oligopeptide/nickel transport system permease component